MTLGTAALMGDTTVNALEATTEALRLVGPEPTVLRAKALSVHAHANADRQRADEAMRWAQQALGLGEQLGAPAGGGRRPHHPGPARGAGPEPGAVTAHLREDRGAARATATW